MKETVLKKALREKCMMTMEEAAIKIGVHPTTMSKWNNGKVKITPVSFRKLFEMGVPRKVLIDPSKEV